MKRAGQTSLTLLSALALTLFTACGSSGPGGDGDGDGDGDACDSATNCTAGQICDPDTNTCVTDKSCTGNPECGNGGYCDTAAGNCVASTTGSPCDGDTQCQDGEACVGAGNPTGGFCGCDGDAYEPMAVAPNMLIVLDRSGSMNDSGGGGKSKWQHAVAAITQLLTDYDGQIRFGLAMYPDSGGGCDIPSQVDVGIGDNQGATIEGMLPTSAINNGSTPLADILHNTVIGYQGLLDPTRPNYTMIINDGEPNCLDAGHPNDFKDPSPDISTLKDDGILSYVIGFGAGVNPDVLNDMAVAGGTARSGTDKYYQADNATELQQALDEIGGSVLSCTFALNADQDAQVLVFGDGKPLDFSYDRNNMTVTVNGADCDMLRVGDIMDVVVVNSCPISTD